MLSSKNVNILSYLYNNIYVAWNICDFLSYNKEYEFSLWFEKIKYQ